MAEKLFAGNELEGAASASATIYVQFDEDYPAYDGVITSIGFWGDATGGGNMKAAIYDLVGAAPASPGNLIWASSPIPVSSSSWNFAPVTPFAVTTSTGLAFGGVPDSTNTYCAYAGVSSQRAYKNTTYATYVPEDPAVGYTSGNWTSSWCVVLYGWEPPTVSSCDTDPISAGATVTIGGTDFMTDSNPITVEICNNSNYAAATVKTTQTVTAQADTSVTFTAVTTGLSGESWIFVTTDLGQMNATGYSVTVGRTVYAWVERSDGLISATPYEVLLLP